jgi:hypothetical protein
MFRRLLPLVLALAAFAQNAPAPTQNAEAAKLVEIPAEVPGDAARYSLLIMGNKSGVIANWQTRDGAQQTFFAFNDRGRGPRLRSTVSLDAGGTPSTVKISGNDYLKAPVAESFSLASNHAQWKNDSEAGDKQLTAPAYYIAMNSSPLEYGWLARALLKSNRPLALLPAGEARISKLRDLPLSSADMKQTITAYAITGLDLTPTIVWLDADQNFFAAGDGSWFLAIREGWESTAPDISAAIKKIEVERAATLARKLPHRPTGLTVFNDVAIFDSTRAVIVPHQRVTISGNRIRSVGPADANLPADAQVIDGRGKFLLPGLWDMHTHVSPNDGLLNLAAGVTTVRDLANDPDDLNARRDRIEKGEELGPRIISAGFIDGPGPFQGPTKALAATEAEARDWVRKYAAMGYAQIKIYSSLKPELVPVVADEAHKHGMRLSGHIPAGMTAAEGIRAGMDEVQHINFIMLNFMPDVKDTQTPKRFTEPAKRAADLDLNSAEVKSFIALMKEHKTCVDPTLDTFENMFTGRPGQIPPGFAAVADRLPPQVRRGLLTGALPIPAGMEQRYKDSYAAFLKMTKLLRDNGIPTEIGTDDFAGFALHREIELHASAGIPNSQVLQDATLMPAQIMKKDADLGSISPNKLADLVLLDADPVADISNIRKVNLTMKDGVIYRPDELNAELGIAPRTR